MGRDPNPIVQEFFHRGQKLTDRSNRYVHTCRRCGEVFPKGRVDTLLNHILRRCLMVGQEERKTISQGIQQPTPKPPRTIRNGSTHSQQPLEEHAEPGLSTSTPNDLLIPFLLEPQQSALDTLAEVSRRHLDYSSNPRGNPDDSESLYHDSRRQLAEQALWAERRDEHGTSPYLVSLGSDIPGSDGGNEDHALIHNQYPVVSTPTGGSEVSPLVQTASAANQELQYLGEPNQGSSLDPQLEGLTSSFELDSSNAKFDAPNAAMISNTVPSRDQDPGQISSPKPVSKHRRISRVDKAKQRGQFSPTRRKEVHEIRLKGACLRCRMLKKPCSEETPCRACRRVRSTRVWTQPCIRTRLADLVALWSTGLFHARAKSKHLAAAHGLEPSPTLRRIEVRLTRRSNVCVSLESSQLRQLHLEWQDIDQGLQGNGVRETTNPDAPEVQPNPSAHHEKLGNSDGETFICVLEDNRDLAAKVIDYLSQVTDVCINDEPLELIRTSLRLARTSADAQGDSKSDSADPIAVRSSYNIQNQLLESVVELWVGTSILVRYVPGYITLSDYEAQDPEAVHTSTDRDQTSDGPAPTSTPFQDLALSEFLAAIESRCNTLNKTVLNELERRLIQRQNVPRFPTFLAAVILLNCVERMTGLYQSFDTLYAPSSDHPHTGIDTGLSIHDHAVAPPPPDSASPSSSPSDWPLDTSARKLWQYSAGFADVLLMLLRMRDLMPRTTVAADGTLVVATARARGCSTSPLLTSSDGAIPETAAAAEDRPHDATTVTPEAAAVAWLDPLRLNVDDLVRISRSQPSPPSPAPEQHHPGHDGSRASPWDLKFISPALLPGSEEKKQQDARTLGKNMVKLLEPP